MKISDLLSDIEAKVVCGDASKSFEGVYVGDLLSRAMSHVVGDGLWITIMSNTNVVAVASLTEPAAVILAEDVALGEEALRNAKENDVTVLSSPLSSYELCVRINRLAESAK